MGEQKVLSTTTMSPRARALAATAAMSTSLSVGLVGVSIHSIFVFGCTAASKAASSDRSTKLKSRPALRRRTRSNRR